MEHKVSIIGCGLMGSAIARTLYRKRFPVMAFNRSPEPLTAMKHLGIPATTNIDKAVVNADTLIIVLSNYGAVRSVLNRVSNGGLKGKLMLNLTSGSVLDAAEMRETAAGLGADYLDGSIWTLPSMIGDTETVITVGGSEHLWDQAEHVVKQLGGGSFHAGEAIGSGNVLEACFPGAFYMTAQNCFIESMQLASKSGIGIDVIARSVSPSLRLLRLSLDGLIAAIEKGDNTALEATMDVYLNAAKSYQLTAAAVDRPGPFLDLLVDQLEDAVNRGQGHLGPSVLFQK
ncbi:6-phosphogluconate dehydrogenase NAD-binding (plasmid) [Rhizobium leguminosarum bv. trifolii WSM2304]|uniref:6-phosphogluconate dehydrogenase NAD-binding n=1 Tax=Rhizobium leguminosarum bv. trifolii (strain WSM2304) TaxID=395492 RepID=A0ABF7QZM0_RHILW|nr:NAD(P)-binding domain-containing protein [Rhizobium leguminosarum]ACI59716.1 6-phosphogluconate dehydrogenase NAD-binding [Rhizobium leguminosarum bv. trifolii WSM2304]